MKSLVVFFLAAVLLSSTAFGRDTDPDLKVLSTKRSVLYFKVSKDLIGATIQIENGEHALIESIPVDQRKMIVDFFFLAPGTYTVKVMKGSLEYDIEYVNE